MRSLICVFKHVWDGGRFPEDTQQAIMVLPPKGDDERGYFHPKDLRPLSLSNTDCKIWAGLVNRILTTIIPQIISPFQNATRNRSVNDHVSALDAYSLMAARTGGSPSAVLLCDIKAAFPSLAHRFLFAVLSKIMGDSPLVHILMELYRENVASVFLFGDIVGSIAVRSGIRQGCPASGSIFVICFDLWLKYVDSCSSSPSANTLARTLAFADDVAFILYNFWAVILVVYNAFMVLARATGLEAHPMKMILIPLWPRPDLTMTRRRISAMIPAWANITVSLSGKYLGMVSGPLGHTLRWVKPVAKFHSRVGELQALGASWSFVSFLYSCVAASVLSYPMQFSLIPHDLISSASVHSRVLKLPKWRIPVDIISSFGKFGVPFELKDLLILNRATMYRAWCKSPAAYLLNDIWDDHMNNDDEHLLNFGYKDWMRTSPFLTMRENYLTITAIPRHPDPVNTAEIQSKAYKFLADRAFLSLEIGPAIARRLSRLNGGIAPSGSCIDKAVFMLRFACQKLPKAVIPPLIRTLLNAWTCNLQEVSSCCFCLSEDSFSMRHFFSCNCVLNALLSLSSWVPPRGGLMKWLLDFDPHNLNDLVMRILSFDAVHFAVMARHCACHHRINMIGSRMMAITRTSPYSLRVLREVGFVVRVVC